MISPSPSITISAQPGPQTAFLQTAADICIYGGAAGGGKTVGLILEPLRHVGRVPGFTAVFFRRTTPQITNPGGLWDESQNFYPRLGGIPHLRAQEWRWPRGGKIKFSHLQLRTTVHDWQGAQIALICFDELTHFTAHQFFYMVSRNRSTCGVRPYIRATCNPDSDSWDTTSCCGTTSRPLPGAASRTLTRRLAPRSDRRRADRGTGGQDPAADHQPGAPPPQIADGLDRFSGLVSRARPLGADPLRQLCPGARR